MRPIRIGPAITNRNEDSVNIYLNEISKYDRLTPAEEVALAIRIREGDTAAFNKLVTANLLFAVSVAKKHLCQQSTLADLINVANMGLIYAATRFDETRGFKFISYAVWWIRHFLNHDLEENLRPIRLPGSQLEIISKVKKARAVLEQKFEREPTDEEIAEFADLAMPKVRDSDHFGHQVYSLDSPDTPDGTSCLLDGLVDANALSADYLTCDDSFTTDVVMCMEALLEPRIQLILKHFFGLDGYEQKTIEDIAPLLRLGEERTRQLKYKGIRLLREYFKDRSGYRN